MRRDVGADNAAQHMLDEHTQGAERNDPARPDPNSPVTASCSNWKRKRKSWHSASQTSHPHS